MYIILPVRLLTSNVVVYVMVVIAFILFGGYSIYLQFKISATIFQVKQGSYDPLVCKACITVSANNDCDSIAERVVIKAADFRSQIAIYSVWDLSTV